MEVFRQNETFPQKTKCVLFLCENPDMLCPKSRPPKIYDLHNLMSAIICTDPATGGILLKRFSFKISQNSQKKTCIRVSFLIKFQASAYNFFIKQTLAQVFSRIFYEIFNCLYKESSMTVVFMFRSFNKWLNLTFVPIISSFAEYGLFI